MATYLSNRLTYPRRLFLWLLGYSILLVGCFIVFQYNREKEFKAEKMNTRLQMINTYILTELKKGKDIREISLADYFYSATKGDSGYVVRTAVPYSI